MDRQMKLYEYAIILQPLYDADDKLQEKGQLLDQGAVLADSEQNAQIQAARRIPEEYMEALDRVTLAMRPF